MNKVTINTKENKSEETLLTAEIWELVQVLTIWGIKGIAQTVRNLAVLGRGQAWALQSRSPGPVSSHMSLNCKHRNTPLHFYSALELTMFSLIYIP